MNLVLGRRFAGWRLYAIAAATCPGDLRVLMVPGNVAPGPVAVGVSAVPGRKNGRYQIAGCLGLDDITSSAQVKGFLGNLRRTLQSQKDDLGRPDAVENSASSLNSIQPRETDIHEHQIRLQFQTLTNCLQPVT